MSLIRRVNLHSLKELVETVLFRWSYDWESIKTSDDKTLILFFNSMWGQPLNFPESDLPEGCEITTNKQRFREAAAVVFHIPSLGCLNRVRKSPGQIWVARSKECETHYPRLRDPDFMKQFDLTMTYHRHADVVDPYYGPHFEQLLRTRPKPKTWDKLVTFFASSDHDRSGRIGYAAELMRYLEVHSFGRRLRNRRLTQDRGRTTKLETIAGYKFTLAFENAVAEDYVTEKFYDPLIAGSVPVYLGALNVDDFAPADHCYINVADFKNPKALAQYLLALNRNDAEYQKNLAWKHQPLRPTFLKLLDEQRTHPLIRLCQKVQDLKVCRQQ